MTQTTLQGATGKCTELNLGRVARLQLAQRVSILGQVHLSPFGKHLGRFISGQLANLYRHRVLSTLPMSSVGSSVEKYSRKHTRSDALNACEVARFAPLRSKGIRDLAKCAVCFDSLDDQRQ